METADFTERFDHFMHLLIDPQLPVKRPISECQRNQSRCGIHRVLHFFLYRVTGIGYQHAGAGHQRSQQENSKKQVNLELQTHESVVSAMPLAPRLSTQRTMILSPEAPPAS